MKKVKFGNTSIPGPCKKPGGADNVTSGKAPERIRQSTTPVDASKPGSMREWPTTSQTMMARNRWGAKRPDPNAITIGPFGAFFGG